jgi:hypothetical protein
MKDIKELIYAAVEENAVKFQELVNAQLQVRAYDAIEALRPEVGASMFGEAKKMEDDEEEMEDEDEDEEMEDEMDDKKKSMKEALHPNQQKIDVVDDEKIDAKDFAKLRKMKKMKEEVEGLDELSTEKLLKYREAAKKDADVKNKAWDKKKLSDEGKYKLMNRETGTDQADQKIKRKTGSYRPGILARVGARLRNEEAVNEVAMPKNAADWQAMINHQIKVTGHPVATDAQFRAQHGKDTSKIASLEPGEDKLQYATAQGGTVKQ